MKNLIAFFPDHRMTEKAIGALLDHGVDKDHISLITGEQNLEDLYTSEAARNSRAEGKGVTTTTADDAATGALKGAGIGLGVGALAGLASLFIPGYGLVFGGGALMTASVAAMSSGAAGGVAGATHGYLKDQGLDDSLIGEYKAGLEERGAVIAVEAEADSTSVEKIRAILTKYHGTKINLTESVMVIT